MDATQTRLTLCEIARELVQPLFPVADAMRRLGLHGRKINGVRYWTVDEVKQIEQAIEQQS